MCDEERIKQLEQRLSVLETHASVTLKAMGRMRLHIPDPIPEMAAALETLELMECRGLPKNGGSNRDNSLYGVPGAG